MWKRCRSATSNFAPKFNIYDTAVGPPVKTACNRLLHGIRMTRSLLHSSSKIFTSIKQVADQYVYIHKRKTHKPSSKKSLKSFPSFAAERIIPESSKRPLNHFSSRQCFHSKSFSERRHLPDPTDEISDR